MSAIEDLSEGVTVGALKGFAKYGPQVVAAIRQAWNQPSTMTDLTPDPGVQAELQNDLESQIAAGK